MERDKKEDILRLRAEGKSYNEIQRITGASKGTISYHCGAGQKEKSAARRRKFRMSDEKRDKLYRRISTFRETRRSLNFRETSVDARAAVRNKIRKFSLDITSNTPTWGVKEFLENFGDTTNCYLTGARVDITDPDTFSLDHIVPKAQGGTNDISNVGITTFCANQAKTDMGLEEFVMLCFDVVEHWLDYEGE